MDNVKKPLYQTSKGLGAYKNGYKASPSGDAVRTLIPLEDFKALMGIDDREDKTARFCLVTSTFSIEQYCKRRLLRKKHFERIDYYGDLPLPPGEYPVKEVLASMLTIRILADFQHGVFALQKLRLKHCIQALHGASSSYALGAASGSSSPNIFFKPVIEFYISYRLTIFCPEEDLNFHTLASTST